VAQDQIQIVPVEFLDLSLTHNPAVIQNKARAERVRVRTQNDGREHRSREIQPQRCSLSGSTGYLGLRPLFGGMTRADFTGPTRSRAIALTSFAALKTFFFLAIQFLTKASATRDASASKVTIS
jgi:hypothetical protein